MVTTKHATTNYRMLKPYLSTVEKNNGYSQFRAERHMPLSLEYLRYLDYFGDEVWAISHTGEQNGDLMRDPEMLIAINHTDGTVRPLSFENSYVGLYQRVFDSARYFRPRLLRELDEFLWGWLKHTITPLYNPKQGIAIENVTSWEA